MELFTACPHCETEQPVYVLERYVEITCNGCGESYEIDVDVALENETLETLQPA